MDYFAAISWGTYPTPTPTGAARAAYFASYGLLGTAPTAIARSFGLVRMKTRMTMR